VPDPGVEVAPILLDGVAETPVEAQRLLLGAEDHAHPPLAVGPGDRLLRQRDLLEGGHHRFPDPRAAGASRHGHPPDVDLARVCGVREQAARADDGAVHFRDHVRGGGAPVRGVEFLLRRDALLHHEHLRPQREGRGEVALVRDPPDLDGAHAARRRSRACWRSFE